MSTEWYYQKNGRRVGPLSPDDLKTATISGTITPDDLVWSAGMPAWVKAKRIAALFPNGSESPRPQNPQPAAPARTNQPVFHAYPEPAPAPADDITERPGELRFIAPLYVGLAIVCFFPLGFYLLSRHPTLARNRRWWIAACLWSALVFLRAVADNDRLEAPKTERPGVQSTDHQSNEVGPKPAQLETDDYDGKKTYKVSNGLLKRSVSIEVPNRLGLDFSHIQWADSFLEYTVTWTAYRGINPNAVRWAAYDSTGVRICDGPFPFGGVIKSGEPIRARLVVLPRDWEHTATIKFDNP
jgi:hypothetical protein